MTKKVAFIGLGNMGGPMAKNLINEGFAVTVYDLNKDAMAELKAAGASIAAQATDAVADADFVISMLPNGAIVKSLYIGNNKGNNGLIDHLKDGVLVIDSSTIAADDARTVAKACEMKGIAMIDAPVSGGTAAAQAGSLTFICGGEAEHYEAAQPVLKAMGKNIFHAGASGAGQVAKICNNMLLAIHMIGSAEALNMGAQQGLDPAVKEQVEIQAKYAGYIDRQKDEIARNQKHLQQPIPTTLDFTKIAGLSNEIIQKLQETRPETVAQASRISGVTPAAISLLLITIKKHKVKLAKLA